MPVPRCIVLMTDFGLQDAYVGILKGVIERLAPGARVLDLSHGIPAGDLRWGAYLLQTSLPYLPPYSVLVAVVDPGVGSARRGLCIQAGDYWLVGPDNGLFSPVLRQIPASAIYSLENPDYFLHPLSQTFHGRDVFAPVAAHLFNGISPAVLGPICHEITSLSWPSPEYQEEGVLRGEVLLFDHFGNLITNFSRTEFESLLDSSSQLQIVVAGKVLHGLQRTYADAPTGNFLALWGSGGYLEISLNQGHAQQVLGAAVGTPVFVHLL